MNRTGIRWDPAPTGDRSDSGQKDAASLAGDLSQRSPDRSPDSLEERHPGETMGSQLGRSQASVENPAVGRLVEEGRRVAHLLECDIDLEASRHPAAPVHPAAAPGAAASSAAAGDAARQMEVEEID